VRGASYINLSDDGYRALLRRIRKSGETCTETCVFISYAHKDDQSWLDMLLQQSVLAATEHGIEIWSDRDMQSVRNGRMIQSALDRAKVACCWCPGLPRL